MRYETTAKKREHRSARSECRSQERQTRTTDTQTRSNTLTQASLNDREANSGHGLRKSNGRAESHNVDSSAKRIQRISQQDTLRICFCISEDTANSELRRKEHSTRSEDRHRGESTRDTTHYFYSESGLKKRFRRGDKNAVAPQLHGAAKPSGPQKATCATRLQRKSGNIEVQEANADRKSDKRAQLTRKHALTR